MSRENPIVRTARFIAPNWQTRTFLSLALIFFLYPIAAMIYAGVTQDEENPFGYRLSEINPFFYIDLLAENEGVGFSIAAFFMVMICCCCSCTGLYGLARLHYHNRHETSGGGGTASSLDNLVLVSQRLC